MNVDTIFVLSDPLKVGRLYYILNPFLDKNLRLNSDYLNSVLQKGKRKYLKSAKAMEKYNRYEQMVLDSLMAGKFNGKKMIFLSGVSPDLMETGKPGRSGVDPFCHLYGLSENIIELLSELPPEVGEYCRNNIVFWPVAPIDFPFVADNSMIQHFLMKETMELSKAIEDEGKIGFGSLEKSLRDIRDKRGSYEFKERLFDSKKLKKTIEDNPSMYQKERKKKGFFKALSRYTQLSRLLMAEKYKLIFKLTGIKEISLYSTKGGFASEIMERVSRDTGLPIDRVLRSASKITAFRERDHTYLNQLKGRILAWYAKDTNKVIRPEIILKRRMITPEKSFIGCYRYPFFRCEYGAKCIEIKKPRFCTAEYIEQFMPKGQVQLLAEDARKYNYAVTSGEADLYLHNIREFEETTGLRRELRNSTIKERDIKKGKRLLIPKHFEDADTSKYDLRASEFGAKCIISRIFSKVDKEFFPIKLENKFAMIGIAMHWIKNQQPPMWNDFLHNHFLEELGIESTPRWKYREGAVRYEYEGIKISGHPDCATTYRDLEMDENKWDLGIFDIKRGMYSAYEKRGYFDQLLIYGLGIKQMQNLDPEMFYLVLVKTPFDPRRFTKRSSLSEEAYRLHRYSKTKVYANSETVDKLHEDIVHSYNRQQEILNSKVEALKERRESMAKDWCGKNCFDGPLCELVFKEMETKSNMLEILPKPYPTNKHRSELFSSIKPDSTRPKSKDLGQRQLNLFTKNNAIEQNRDKDKDKILKLF